MSTFTVVNDAALVAAIDRCRKQLAYIAPGISAPVADAIGRLFERADPPAVTVIIDADPEVCRLGYGTVAGLQPLRALVERHQFSIRQQPGLGLPFWRQMTICLSIHLPPHSSRAGSTSDTSQMQS